LKLPTFSKAVHAGGDDRSPLAGFLILKNASIAAIIMAALRGRCGHYIFALWFLSIFFFLFLA